MSISGTGYFAHTHGPVHKKFRILFDYLYEEQIVELVSIHYLSGILGEIFKTSTTKTFNSELFGEFELDILEEIATKFESHNAKKSES